MKISKAKYRSLPKQLPKAADGVQQIRAGQNGQRQAISGVVGAVAEGALPGIGGAVVGGLESLSSLTKGEDGLYKSRTAQALDAMNPITMLGRDADAVGKVFSGDFKGAAGALMGDQTDLKAAIAQQKLQKTQADNWARVGQDTSGQVSQYKGGAKRVKTPPKQTYNQPGSKLPIWDTIGYNEDNRESWNDDAARRQYSDEVAATTDRATQLSMGGMSSESEALKKYPTQADVDLRNARQVQRRGPIADKNLYPMGSRKMNTKAIEIEGGEPHFSKKSGGQRSLKQYHPHGPKHSQGGIPTIAAEGDAIVTAKGGKGAQAVAAHRRGDHARVEQLINQMPADKGAPKAKGGIGRAVVRKAQPAASMMTPYQLPSLMGDKDFGLAENDGPSLNSRIAAIANPNQRLPDAPITPYQKTAPAIGSTARSTALGVLQAAPTLYNLGQGLFGNVQKVTRRGFSPEQQQYQDLSGPQRQASTQAQNQQVDNARNLSGGSAGNVRSNANQAFAENAQRQGAIDSQESGRKLAINGQNVEVRNQAQAMNNQMNNQADDVDAQREARKQQYLTTGLEGISGLAGGKLLDGNAQARDQQTAGQIGGMLKNYSMVKGADNNYSWVPKKKNGARAIKVAKK